MEKATPTKSSRKNLGPERTQILPFADAPSIGEFNNFYSSFDLEY